MTQHTQGEWKSRINKNGQTEIRSTQSSADEYMRLIATLPDQGNSQTEANARLIAAAPALLEAHVKNDDVICKTMAEIESGEWSVEQIVDLFVEIQNNARGAIAAAKVAS